MRIALSSGSVANGLRREGVHDFGYKSGKRYKSGARNKTGIGIITGIENKTGKRYKSGNISV